MCKVLSNHFIPTDKKIVIHFPVAMCLILATLKYGKALLLLLNRSFLDIC